MPSAMRRFLSRRLLLRIAAGMFALYAITVGVLLAFEDRFIFHPVPASRRWNEPPAGYVALDVELQAADGTPIHARWFPAADARGAVLICHGQAGNVSLECGPRQLSAWHKQIGVSVCIFDYPGYGRSGGSASEAGAP